LIRFLTSGESHGQALVGIIEGMPAGVPLTADDVNQHLQRRQQGYGRGGRMKIEKDRVEILAGVRFGKTLGSPIALVVRNKDWENWTTKMAVEEIGADVEKVTIPRPGHADLVGVLKYGFDDIRNVIERASARETAMRVACCSVVRKLLEELGIYIGSHVLNIGGAGYKDRNALDAKLQRLVKKPQGAWNINIAADKSQVRVLDEALEAKMIQKIRLAKKRGDTVGGIVEVWITGVPVGLGSYVHYDRRIDAQLTHALVSIHAVKGAEVGDAFANALKFGSEVHDEILYKNGQYRRRTNRAGGTEGGVTTGEPLVVRAAMKPISTLMNPLRAVDIQTKKSVESRRERSDFCAVPACSVVAEAVVAPVVANALLEKFGGDSLAEIRQHLKGLSQ
jgi:chorismate synthase